jgi:putative ATP-binding cassette transporter
MLADCRKFLSELWVLMRPYWRSDERWKSGALVAAIVLLDLGSVWLSVVYNSWSNLFYNTLQNRDFPGFKVQLARFCAIAFANIVVVVYLTYLRQMLEIRWRRWLTAFYVGRWTTGKAYYRLQLNAGSTDNPDQRIAEDISAFITRTLSMGLGLLDSVVTLASFASILWMLSGAITIAGLTIPGYMLWAALIYAVLGTWLVNRIGRPLIRLNFQQQQFEANFRYSLVRLRENAEGVALYGGETEESRGFSRRFADVVGNWWAIMRRQKRLNWYSSFYGQIATIFPVVVAAPRVFSGAIEIGGLMQTADAFAQVQSALSWFINVYASFADWKATIDRLTSFNTALSEIAEAGQGKLTRTSSVSGIAVDGLTLFLPDGRPLLKDLSLTLPAASRTLVTGPSGVGKSTLFRALAGLWPYAEGSLALPEGERLLFLPQKPYLPIATLKAALTYPDSPDPYPTARIEEVLAACGLASFADRLDVEDHWSQCLSPGEQQRLAIARALLLAPRWLFLDEATAALDEASEVMLYRLLVDRLPSTALVSIAHRPTLAAFHDRTIVFPLAPGQLSG